MVKDIATAFIKAGYHAVAVQVHERTGKETQADKPYILQRLGKGLVLMLVVSFS